MISGGYARSYYKKILFKLINYMQLKWESANLKDVNKFKEIWYKKSIFAEMVQGWPR
jgi:hypothetical protein